MTTSMHAQTYRDFQAYPQYLVTFKRRAAHVAPLPPARWAPALATTALSSNAFSSNAFQAAAFARALGAVTTFGGGVCYLCLGVNSHIAACPLAAALYGASSATGGAFRVARAGHARAVALVTLERVGATNLTLAIQRVAGGAWGAYHLAVVFFVAAQARHAGKISQPSVPGIRDMHRLNTRATKA